MGKEDVTIKQTIEHLKETFEISEIYLFGSILGAGFNGESDIDIALYLEDYENHSLKDFAGALFHIQNRISSRIELHFFPARNEPLTFSDFVRNTGRKVA